MILSAISRLYEIASLPIPPTDRYYLPFIQEAEYDFILPLLGQDFFDELNNEPFVDDDSKKAQFRGLLDHPIANFAKLLSLPSSSAKVDVNGIHQIKTANQEPITQWRYNRLVDSIKDKGYKGIERALAFLFDNIDAFETFAESDAYKLATQRLLANASTFNKYYRINGSQLIYSRLLPILERIEQFYIEPILGTALFQELKEKLLNKDLAEEQEKYLSIIRPALAHLAIYHGLIELSVFIGENGLLVYETTSNSSNHELNKELADNKKMHLMNEAEKTGKAYLQKLKIYLDQTQPDGYEINSNNIIKTQTPNTGGFNAF